MAAGDFDGDGDIDLAAANKGSGTLSILFNDGNGGFSEVSVSPMFSVPISVTGGDVDADGDLDLAVANLRAGTSSILSNNGNGSFTPHSVSTVEDFPRSIAAGDFDDNGSLDLAVANFGSNTISILLNGSIVQIADDMPALPRRFALHQNVPNPFNPTTAIKYDLPKPARVKLEVFNILGQRVITLVNHLQSADYYTVQWNGINTSGVKVGSGMYIYRLTAEATDGSDTFTKVKKMLLVR
ncbi:MAG: T9SS type A sorting domain-containing protein [candidate division Zixibacteria bacterium]|nr:T9SS type A sorting domain-containing protein [candidate division Zixibacteria bacterium]